MGKRVLYIWDADYPWDVRVEKICKSLYKNGFEVHIAARNLRRLAEFEIASGIKIHRLKAWKNDRVNYALSFPAFFSPIWKRFLDCIILNNGIEIIIVRDLPMAIAGIWAARRHKIPIIFDMAEDYVAMIQTNWKIRKFNWLNLFVRNPHLAWLVERYALRNFNYILVVVEEAREIVMRGGGNIENVAVVGNTPPLEAFENSGDQGNDKLKLLKERFSGIYVGGLQLGRGIQTVLDAIPYVIKEIPDFLFVVVGDGYAAEEFKKLTVHKQLQDHVLWVGWVNHETVFDYIRLCNIGFIPHFVDAHVNTTIPNKIFDYMGCGLPVIASDALPMKRILDEERCGITFKDRDPHDLARAIVEVYNSGFDYGGNGKKAVRGKYNWQEDEIRLIEVLQKCH